MKKVREVLKEYINKTSDDPILTLFKIRKFYQNKDRLLASCYSDAKKNAVIEKLESIISTVPGDIAECGVYKAGGTILIAEILKKRAINKHIYGFDSFEGMPEAVDEDKMKDGSIGYTKGVLSETSIEYVKEKAKHFKVQNYIKFVKGYFENTIPITIPKDKEFCFVIIDPDQYMGTKFCLEFFYNKVNTGGIILIDDYYFEKAEIIDTPGVKIATDEFFATKSEKPQLLADSMYFIKKL